MTITRMIAEFALLIGVVVGAWGDDIPASSSAWTEVQFAKMGTALNSSEREKVASAVDRLRREDWCAIELVIVVGHADPSEGDRLETTRLSITRSEYVAELLKLFGLPATNMHATGQGTESTTATHGAKAEIIIEGFAKRGNCWTPLDSNGMRLWR